MRISGVAVAEAQEIYEPHIVAFIDLLGFARLIECGKAGLALQALRAVQNDRDGFKGLPETARRLQISMFSDSIVISAPIASERPASSVLTYCRLLFAAMLGRGIVMRGGVACDKLHHQDPLVFGPGMLAAYRLEQQALYPRIVVKRSVADIWLHEVIGNTPDGNRFEQQFAEARDGQLHLRMSSVTSQAPKLPPGTHLRRDYFHAPLKRLVVNLLNDTTLGDRERQKLTWLLHDIEDDGACFGEMVKKVYARKAPSLK